jgi:DNA-binding beta-propeller fold protein YncE
MKKSILRRSVWSVLTLALAAGSGHASLSAQGIIPNDGPYKLTGNSPITYVAVAHVYDPAANRLYSSTRGGVYQYDTTAMSVIGRTTAVRGAGSLALDASRNELYVLALHDDTMNVVDVTTKKIVRSFVAPAWFNVFYEESRGELYYLRGDTREVRVADRESGRTLTTLTLDGRPSFVIGDPARQRVLVRLADKGLIQVIDTKDHSIVASWPARADGPSAMALDETGARVFVSSGRDIVMLDGATGKQLAKAPAGDATYSIVFDPGTQYAVALSGPGRINVLKSDASSLKLVQSLDTRSNVQELFLDPKTHKILGVSRSIDEGLMMDVTSPYATASDGMGGAGSLLTLTLKK